MPAFINYGLEKKIRFNADDIDEILQDNKVIKFDHFVSLLVLASCGGVRTKLGVGNFKNLM